MAMIKGDYEHQGATAARQDAEENGTKQRTHAYRAGSWQARAWQEGYDRTAKQLKAQASALPKPKQVFRTISPTVVAELVVGFPGAAGHHVRKLVEQHNDEVENEARRRRLHNSIARILNRHIGSPGRRAHLEAELRG